MKLRFKLVALLNVAVAAVMVDIGSVNGVWAVVSAVLIAEVITLRFMAVEEKLKLANERMGEMDTGSNIAA